MVDCERPDNSPLEIDDRFALAASQTVDETIVAPTAAEPAFIPFNILDDYRFPFACR
jgi:hypothetical protein